MLFQKLALIASLAALVAAQDISPSDIPRECTAVCAEVLSIAQRCDNENESDSAELSCICQAPNANTLVPTCEACVAQFDRDDDDDDNDVREVLTRCNFTTTTYNSASASSLLRPAVTSLSSAPGTVVVMTSGTVVMTSAVPPSLVPVTSQLPQQTGGAAVSGQGAGVALGVGVVGVVLGML